MADNYTHDEGVGFHLSVNAAGTVSLWDTAEQAKAVAGEQYVWLSLDGRQAAMLKRAQMTTWKAEWKRNTCRICGAPKAAHTDFDPTGVPGHQIRMPGAHNDGVWHAFKAVN